MAEIVQEKSRGLKFAEEQLLRHGWEQGKGLGRDENGISEAIKVKVKCDKGGVGHKQGEQFTFHWWDHVFNKASASLQVESDQNGVLVKKTVEEEDDGAITNRKPRKAALAKAMLYGCFVKSATLLSGQEQPEPKALSSDDNSSSSSSSEDEDQRLDLSSTTKLSDAELIKACGGRTAHKGARHGLTMNAKLARLEQQEAEFMAKYGKKSQSGNTSPECSTPSVQSAAQSPEREEEAAGMEFQKKMSKKTKKEKKPAPCHENVTTVSESQETDVQLKKKKKKKRKEDCEEASGEVAVTVSPKEEFNPLSNTETDHHVNAKTKHKKKKEKKNREEREVMTSGLTPGSKSTSVMREDGEEQEASTEPQTDMDAKAKKKKKKSSKRHEERLVPAEVDQGHDTESNLSDPLSVSTRKNKRKAEGGDGEAEEDATLKKKKKKKHSEVVEIQTDVVNSEAVAPQKKKKKKTKEQKMEQD